MPDTNARRSNPALTVGLLTILLAVLSLFLYGFNVPQGLIPWLNLALPVIGLVFVSIGVKRAFGPEGGGKIWPSILGVVTVALVALSFFIFHLARSVPEATGAPKVGERAPDFTLADSNGLSISLAQLLSAPVAGSSAPKAVLLVFYRGYW